jgi:putative ABC transport system permease protein
MRAMYLAVRGADPLRLVPAVRREVRALDPELPIAKLRPMSELVSQAAARQRFNLLVFSVFAAAALLLAAVGIYGVMAYSVAQRFQEIGVRMALGARPRDVLSLVVRQGMSTALLGVLVGGAAALALSRVMARLLFGVGATDPATYAGIALLVAAVAFVACYLPARRATRVSPVVALRAE